MPLRRILLSLALVPALTSTLWADDETTSPEPPPAQTAPAVPSAESDEEVVPPWSSQVTLVKDRIAGTFQRTKRPSREVTWIREGVEQPLTTGVVLRESDAVRTALGVSVLHPTPGGRVEVGERSQLRVGSVLLQRLGSIYYETPATLEVEVGDLHLVLNEGKARVVSDTRGQGEVQVLSGTVTIEANTPGSQVLVQAGQSAPFGPEGIGSPVDLLGSIGEDIAIWRAERFLPGEDGADRRGRVQLRVEGGMTHLLAANWGRVGLDGRGRLGGDFWLTLGASAVLRPGEVDEAEDLYWAVPSRVGFRWLRNVGGSALYFGLGADFQLLLFPGCPPTGSCESGLLARPGVRVAGVAGVALGRSIGLDVEVAGGAHAFSLDSEASDDPAVLPQVSLSFAVVFRP